MGQGLAIDLAGTQVVLQADGTIYWKEEGCLFIADLHLGKANHFRKAGIAVPLAVQDQNLARLQQSLQQADPDHVYFLGDLFHSDYNKSWLPFEKLLADYSRCTFHLIIGNHDILDRDRYHRSGVSLHEEGLEVGPFSLTHHPIDHQVSGYGLCGHLHPSVRLSGKGKQSLKLSCFWETPTQMILPAFGGFTGTHRIQPSKGDRVFVLTNDSVIMV